MVCMYVYMICIINTYCRFWLRLGYFPNAAMDGIPRRLDFALLRRHSRLRHELDRLKVDLWATCPHKNNWRTFPHHITRNVLAEAAGCLTGFQHIHRCQGTDLAAGLAGNTRRGYAASSGVRADLTTQSSVVDAVSDFCQFAKGDARTSGQTVSGRRKPSSACLFRFSFR